MVARHHDKIGGILENVLNQRDHSPPTRWVGVNAAKQESEWIIMIGEIYIPKSNSFILGFLQFE